jgi:hypothetical protein
MVSRFFWFQNWVGGVICYEWRDWRRNKLLWVGEEEGG